MKINSILTGLMDLFVLCMCCSFDVVILLYSSIIDVNSSSNSVSFASQDIQIKSNRLMQTSLALLMLCSCCCNCWLFVLILSLSWLTFKGGFIHSLWLFTDETHTWFYYVLLLLFVFIWFFFFKFILLVFFYYYFFVYLF